MLVLHGGGAAMGEHTDAEVTEPQTMEADTQNLKPQSPANEALSG